MFRGFSSVPTNVRRDLRAPKVCALRLGERGAKGAKVVGSSAAGWGDDPSSVFSDDPR